MYVRVFRSTGFLCLLTVGAFLLHSLNLESRSLWLDEGFTLMRIFGSWSDLVRNIVYWNGTYTIDTNPQVYFFALKLWSVFAGRSEFVLEVFSLFGAVLFVPLCFAVTRGIFGARAGVLAAIAASLSPLLAWYAVELRMYSWVVNLAAFALLLLCRLLVRPSLLALAMHYSFIGMLIAHGVLLLVVLLRAGNLRPLQWAGLGAAAVVALLLFAYIVDAPTLWVRFFGGAEYSYEFKPLYDVVGSIASGMLFGINQRDPSGGWISWIFISAWVIGVVLLSGVRTRDRRSIAILASVLIPIGVWYGLSLVKPNFAGVRHLMLVLPAMLALLGAALDCIVRRSRIALILPTLLIAVNMYGLSGVLLPSAEKQDDWRGVAQTVRSEWRPGDLVIANSGTPREVVQGYLADLPVPVFSVVNIDMNRVAAARRIWYLNTGAVDYLPDRGLDWVRALSMQQAYRFPARTNTIELLLLTHDEVFARLPVSATVVESISDTTGDRIMGWEVMPSNPYAPTPNLQLRLYWRRGAQLRIERTLSLRLRSASQTVLDVMLSSRLPARSVDWTTGNLIAIDYAIALPAALPPVSYEMELVVYEGPGGVTNQIVRAPFTDEQVTCCIRHAVWQPASQPSSAADVAAYHPPTMVRTTMGFLFDRALIAVDHDREVMPGRTLFLGLTWQDADGAWTQGASLETLLGHEVGGIFEQAPLPGLLPEHWPANEPLRTTIALPIPDTTMGGWYRLSAWRDRGHGRVRAYIGLVHIAEYPLVQPADPREMQVRMNASAGEFALLGYSIDSPLMPGRTSTVSTYWRVDDIPLRDGVIFVHILGPDGVPVAQDDHPPENGARSTRTFRAGAGHRERNTFKLPANLKPGVYTIYVGIYDRQGMQRWSAFQNGTPVKDDLIVAGRFTVNP
ncbi:MAG: hypothetical protein NTZ50_07705 [Chloroflexi bacterium]|nr:hypothetical protein [Chloroflexota bacterium]